MRSVGGAFAVVVGAVVAVGAAVAVGVALAVGAALVVGAAVAVATGVGAGAGGGGPACCGVVSDGASLMTQPPIAAAANNTIQVTFISSSLQS